MPDRFKPNRPAEETDETGATPPRGSEIGLGSWRGPLIFGVVTTVVCVLAAAEIAPRDGESLLLRWVRTAAHHPLRSGLAWTLVAASLAPPAASHERP